MRETGVRARFVKLLSGIRAVRDCPKEDEEELLELIEERRGRIECLSRGEWLEDDVLSVVEQFFERVHPYQEEEEDVAG